MPRSPPGSPGSLRKGGARHPGSPGSYMARQRRSVAPAPGAPMQDVETWTGEILSLRVEAGGTFPDMRIEFEAQSPIPEELAAQLNTPNRPKAGGELGRNSRLLVVDHDAFRGLARVLLCEEGKVVTCRDARAWATASTANNSKSDARDEGAEGEKYKWTLHRPEGCGHGVNAMVVPAKEEPSPSFKGSAFFLPPLLMHARCSLFSVDHINTANHTFRADVYCELRMRAITEMQDPKYVEELFSIIHAHENRIDFRNASEYLQDKEVWVDHVPSPLQKGTYDYCFKVRTKALFNESWDLRSFPFDVQEVNVVLVMSTSSKYVMLVANEESPSLFQSEAGFQLSNTFELGLHDLVLTIPELSDASESSAGSVYPRCVFRTYLRRRAYSYIATMVVPMGIITMLMALSSGSENARDSLTLGVQRVYMGTADRLNVTLTLILTAVAYKIVVASSTPKTHYLTMLEVHHLVCFAFLLVAVLENVIYATYVEEALNLDVAPEDLIQEWIVFSAYLGLFLLINVLWGLVLIVRKFRFRTVMRDLRMLELIKREAANLRDDDIHADRIERAPSEKAQLDWAARIRIKHDLMAKATLKAGGVVNALWRDPKVVRRLVGLHKGKRAAPFMSHFGGLRSFDKERQQCKTLLEEVRRKQLLSELHTISSPKVRSKSPTMAKGSSALYGAAHAAQALPVSPMGPRAAKGRGSVSPAMREPSTGPSLAQSELGSRGAWQEAGGDRFFNEPSTISPVRAISPEVDIMTSHQEEEEEEEWRVSAQPR